VAVLPEVFYQRRANRGLENVAISPDGKTAVTFMQSPMGKSTNSSVVHSAVLDISDVQAPKLTAVYLYLGEDKGGGLQLMHVCQQGPVCLCGWLGARWLLACLLAILIQFVWPYDAAASLASVLLLQQTLAAASANALRAVRSGRLGSKLYVDWC
jgi:hypothetical protein